MLGVIFYYLENLIIRNMIGLFIFIGFIYFYSDIDFFYHLNNLDYKQYLLLLNDFYYSAINNKYILEDMFLIFFTILNFELMLEVLFFYKDIALPYSLNLTHKVKNLSKDNGTISYLDKFKFFTHNPSTITFKNKISIDIKRYEDNIEQIRNFLSIPKDTELHLEQTSSKTIDIHINTISSYIDLDITKILPNKIYMGETYNKEDFYLDINSLTHCLTVGESGSGKSTLINLQMISLLKNINLINQLFLIDFKGVELYRYSQLDKVKFIDKMEQLVSLLENLTSIMNERYEKLKQSNELKHKEDYIFVVIEEVGTIGTYPEKKVKDKVFSLLTNLLQKARAANIYFLIFAQKIEISVLPSSITTNIQSKILMKTDNDYNQQQTIGTKENIKKITNVDVAVFNIGRCIFKDGITSEKVVCQVPYFQQDNYKDLIEK